MKIALLNIQYYPNIEGGAEISVQKLAEKLALNNDVYVLCDGIFNGFETKVNNVTVVRMPARIEYKNKIERIFTRSFKIQCYKQLKEILQIIKPDVLHTNNLHAFSVIVWKVASDLKIPVIHTLRDYTLLQTVRLFEQKINIHYSNKVKIVTAPSQYTLNQFLKEKYFKKSIGKKCIPNAIDFTDELINENYINKMSKKDETIRFAYIGRYHPDKGVDWLIEVFSSIENNCELHLYGKGELTSQSKSIIRTNSRIHDHGFLNEEMLLNELNSIDIVIVPSLWDEPFGRTIIDGYKSICPVIITNRGGMPEVVDNMKTGLILPHESSESLCEAINYLNDRRNIQMMLPNIREKIYDYSIERQVEAFQALYSELI